MKTLLFLSFSMLIPGLRGDEVPQQRPGTGIPEKLSPLGIGDPAVAFVQPALNGRTIHFPEDYKGRLVMLDFWATWCGPCRRELPGLSKAYSVFHNKGFDVLSVSLDDSRTIKGLATFTSKNQMPWPQICDGKGWEAAVAALYGVSSIPACWLVDGTTGRIVAMRNELRGEALQPTIERCLAGLGKEPVGGASVAAATKSAGGSPAQPKSAVDETLISQVRSLAKEGLMMTAEAFSGQLKAPKAGAVVLPERATQPLRGREIAERASAAYLRAGWVYHCSKCGQWHTNLAGGYAIAKDAAATAFHVMAVPVTMLPGEGYPVLVRGSDVLLVEAVVAADETMDAVILRTRDKNLKPLALSAEAQVGDAVFCLSDPRGARGYFSTGIVNRFYTPGDGAAGDPRTRRLNVSTDWSRGSSGAAVLDECGNAVGHVARIQSLYGDAAEHGEGREAKPALMTLHEAIPAGSVLTLVGRAAVLSN